MTQLEIQQSLLHEFPLENVKGQRKELKKIKIYAGKY